MTTKFQPAAYWYPTWSHAEGLAKELVLMERVSAQQVSHSLEFLPLISRTLSTALNADGFPQHQIGQWVWLASQFRMLAAADDAEAVVAGAALNFLGKRVDAGKIEAAVIQDLNWVLDSTVRRLRGKLRPEGFRSCLTSDELIAIESRLAQFASISEFDADAIRQRVQRQVCELETLSLDDRINGVVAKVDTLFEATTRNGKEGAAARSALLYLSDKDDALGVLGLLDDVYVIDWAYAVVEGLTRCLPLLLAFLDQWPFVADLAVAGAPPMPLDRFSQYIACACLNSLFAERQPDLLIVRESAGYGGIAALFAAVQCVRMQGNDLDAEIGTKGGTASMPVREKRRRPAGWRPACPALWSRPGSHSRRKPVLLRLSPWKAPVRQTGWWSERDSNSSSHFEKRPLPKTRRSDSGPFGRREL